MRLAAVGLIVALSGSVCLAQTEAQQKEGVLQAVEQIRRGLTDKDRAILDEYLNASSKAEAPEEAIERIGNSLPPKERKVLINIFQKAWKDGFRLSTRVRDDVSVHAVLLPFALSKSVFGKEIAENFVAIQLIVSNRSADAALIVQELHMDYSDWALSGGGLNGQGTRPPEPHQAATVGAQIASVESRIVRGAALDAQKWTARNWMMRSLKLAGSMAAGYQFAFNEQGIIRGIAAFNGQVIPAAEVMWPDGTIDQINRISDVGFQVNKVIPKESADVIVAFYPMARFLTPGLRELFKKAPAVFFAPGQLAYDRTVMALLRKYTVGVLEDEDMKKLRLQIRCSITREANRKDLGPECNTDCKCVGTDLVDYLNAFSLNTVRVIVGGVMSVDVDKIAAGIEEIVMDGGNDAPAVWAQTGKKTGTIRGRYLTGAELVIDKAADLEIDEIRTIAAGSTDRLLKFELNLKKPVPSGTILTLRLRKKASTEKPEDALLSNPYLIAVSFVTPAPQPGKSTRTGDTVTIRGSNFFNVSGQTLSVILNPSAPSGDKPRTVPSAAITTLRQDQIDIDLNKITPALNRACWTPQVEWKGNSFVSTAAFLQPGKPAITAAKTDGKRITVTGADLNSLPDCGSKLTVQVQSTANASAAPQDVKVREDSIRQVSFDAPDGTANWKVILTVEGNPPAAGVAVAP